MTVFDYLAEEFVKLQTEITSICTEMETATNLDPLLERYQEVLDAFTGIDGDNYENNINKKLNLAELGKHATLPISKLSGGEFKLIQIIKEMLHPCEPFYQTYSLAKEEQLYYKGLYCIPPCVMLKLPSLLLTQYQIVEVYGYYLLNIRLLE